MAIRFTHKRMSPGYSDHEHITHLAWGQHRRQYPERHKHEGRPREVGR